MRRRKRVHNRTCAFQMAAIVKRLAHEGAHVALTYVSRPDYANNTAKAAQALGVRAIAIQADSAAEMAA